MKKLSLGILIVLIALSLSGIVVAQNRGRENSTEFVRIIAPGTSFLDRLTYRAKGCKIVHELNDATALRCPKNVQIEGGFEDQIYYIMDLAADQQINADDVWAFGYTGKNVTVAVLDTGIDYNHPELSSSFAGCKSFVSYTESCFDDNGHGTHVSGIITADGIDTNAKGVAPDAKVWMAKVCDSSGSCYSSDIAAAIEYVVKNTEAKIMSISLGGGGTNKANCDTDYLAQKVNWAVDNGVTVVAAAGNTAGKVSSPACASKAIAVGAVDKNDVRARWSGSGLALDIMAPGVSIYSTLPNNNYASWSGTSMATPHVSAVIALLREENSSLTDAQIKEALYKTAKDLGGKGWDKYYGWGRVDALGAINYVK
jgi:subtilisin family serine protease